LDYANGPGPDFWPDFWAACKADTPDSFCFGEVIDAPDAMVTYSGRLDGCLDFHMGEAIRKTFAWGKMTETELNRFLEQHYRYFPDTLFLPTFIDNHDMDRFLFVAGGDKAALKRAATFQMRLPGPPVIYYGTEVGLSQEKSTRDGGLHYSRTPMVWGDKQDKDLLSFYRTLIRQRRSQQ
jgi:glycosidase